MTYPLVSELADAGIPVTVSCRVLKLARQPYYRWRNDPIREADVLRAYRINALHDAHHDDPTFGYRYLADEARRAGWRMSRRTAWKLCSQAGLLSSAQRRRRGKGKKAGPPVFDDHVQRVFRADAPNRLWLTDITEHWTSEGKLYCCAIKDVFSNRIVGYSISDRMTAKLAVDAVRNAVARRGEVAGCILHADRGSQGGFNRSSQHLVIVEVSDGSSSAGSGSGDPAEASVAWSSKVPTARRGGVLGGDRQGTVAHRGCCRGRRGASGRPAMVPQRWRHAALRSEVQAHRALLVVR